MQFSLTHYWVCTTHVLCTGIGMLLLLWPASHSLLFRFLLNTWCARVTMPQTLLSHRAASWVQCGETVGLWYARRVYGMLSRTWMIFTSIENESRSMTMPVTLVVCYKLHSRQSIVWLCLQTVQYNARLVFSCNLKAMNEHWLGRAIVGFTQEDRVYYYMPHYCHIQDII